MPKMMRWPMSALLCLLWATNGAWAQTPKVVAEELRIPHGSGIEIYVRAKRPEGVTQFAPDRIAVMMHGATYPSDPFDLRLGGKSWMDYLAERGFDVYAFDLPGYGRSTRPALMDQPAADSPPYMRNSDAVEALRSVVEYVSKRRGVDLVNLIGWSSGTAIIASYAAENATKVERLVLYAPLWLRTNTQWPATADGKLAAYRVVSREAAEKGRRRGLAPEKAEELLPKASFDAWADAVFATDPKGEGKTLRAPNGVLLDGREYWRAGKPIFDPSKIAAPTLIVVGELDQDTPPEMAHALYPLLVNAKWRRLTLLSDGTHGVLLEKHRMLLFRTVQQFLEEAPPTHDAKF
jgi:pimeloyl-ACP methyl ester carboxylesterase